MGIQKIQQYKSAFDLIAKDIKDNEGTTIEVWYARELQQVLGYARWENFVVAVGRAMGIKSGALADYLPTLTIAAKNLATEMTDYNVEQKDLYGEANITAEHVQNNRSVRGMLGQRGIKPEELPSAEDIKKVERRVAKDEKSMQMHASKLPKK